METRNKCLKEMRPVLGARAERPELSALTARSAWVLKDPFEQTVLKYPVAYFCTKIICGDAAQMSLTLNANLGLHTKKICQ